MRLRIFLVTLISAALGFAQSTTSTASRKNAKRHTSAKHDVGSGAGDIGKGVGKGVGSAAAGTGRAAGHLVTLHPLDAAGDLGRGAVGAGKNVGVGTVKGTGKIVKGTGKAIKHIF